MCSFGKTSHFGNEVVCVMQLSIRKCPAKYALALHCWRKLHNEQETKSVPTHPQADGTPDLVHLSEAAPSHGTGSGLRGWGHMPGPCASGEEAPHSSRSLQRSMLKLGEGCLPWKQEHW